MAIKLQCLRCMTEQAVRTGVSRCRVCRLKSHIHIEEPRCPSCRYLLHELTEPRCLECGQALNPGELPQAVSLGRENPDEGLPAGTWSEGAAPTAASD